jgi:hypothetical protein
VQGAAALVDEGGREVPVAQVRQVLIEQALRRVVERLTQ